MEEDISELLRAAVSDHEGSQKTGQLFTLLYVELHHLAERQLRRSGGSVTLSTTTLVHEAYLDICKRSGADFPDRARFIGYAARAMRGIVIDYMRYSRAAKRGGGAFEITLTGNLDAPSQQNPLRSSSDCRKRWTRSLSSSRRSPSSSTALLLRLRIARDRRSCAAFRSGRFSDHGGRRDCYCATRSSKRPRQTTASR